MFLGLALPVLAESPLGTPFRFVKRPTEPIALASFDVVDAVSETHEITIHFEGEDYRPSFFDDADLRVVGNGFETRPTFVRWQAIRQGDVGYEAHYVISAPEGGWTEAHNGSVAVWLEPEQVARVQGFVAAQMVGTFQVCLGEMTRLESVRYELRGNADDVMGCSAMQSPHGCNRRLTVRVIQERNSEFYIPNVEYAERWEGAVKQDGDVWFLELYQVPKRRYPYEPLWHPRSNVFGGGFRTVGRFTFEPPPGVYEFQLRSMGEVIAREPLTVARNPKVRSESGLVITAPGDVDPVVTVGYWHPEGVDIDSLGDDDLSADAAYTPGRLPPMGERVTFLGAKKDGEWLVGRYRIASPPGGWSFLENGRFVLRTQLGLLRTLTGAQFAESESPPVEGFRVQIDEPFTGPIHVLVRRSAASIVDEALETKVTVTYTADTEVLDLESIDATDLVVMEGVTVIRDAIEVSEQGRVATVEYRVRVGGQIGLGELIVVELAEGAVSTVSGESNRVAPLLGFLNEVPNPRELVVSPATIRKPGALPFRFTIRYPKGALPDHTFEPPSVDVVAVWMREGHWEGPRPPMPFRQTAKIVDTFVLNGRDLQTVEYEILAPDIGWSHLLNGQLALEIEGYSEKPSIKIAVLEARVEASLEIEEAFPGIVGKVKVKTFNEPAVTAVTDWRMIHGAEGTVYLDAIVSPLDVLIPGPIPEYYEQEHTFTLWDLQLPLAFAEFGETDVIVRVNGESVFFKV